MQRLFLSSFLSRCQDAPIGEGNVSLSILPLEHSALKIGAAFKEGDALVEDKGDNLIVHAPFGGTVDNIILHRGKRYYYLKRNAAEIRPAYTAKEPLKLSAGELIRLLRIFGVEDEGQPVWDKIKNARGKARWVVINAVEPEPYFCADSRVFFAQTKEVLLGAEYMRAIAGAQEIIIILPRGSELTPRISKIVKGLDRFRIYETDLSYPHAHSSFLLAEIFGKKSYRDAPLKETVVFRPQGLLAAGEALLFHKPHTETVVSADGAFCNEYGNFRLPIGTPFHFFLRPFSAADSYVIINGGPLSGEPADPKKGIDKNTRVVSVFMPLPPPPQTDCSFCGLCIEYCPCQINPIRLFDMITHKEFTRANNNGRGDCIGCNACSCVCPSYLPLGSTIFLKEDGDE